MTTLKEMAREISKDLNIRQDFTEEVLKRFNDIAIEEIATKGHFKFGFFSISNVALKGYRTPKGIVHPQQRLTIKLSHTVKSLFRYSQKEESVLKVTRDNWRQIISNLTNQKSLKTSDDSSDIYNPFLDETE
jgi:hypothetical protein